MTNKTYFLILVILVIALGATLWNFKDEIAREFNVTSGDTAMQVTMYKNPGCQCCTKWAEHMIQAGFTVEEKPVNNLQAIKVGSDVPYQVSSCHTAFIDDYVVEGHVPVEDVKRMLKEKPDAVGIGVPGMPIGSPGMEGPNPESYQVYLFKKDGSRTVFATH